MDWSSTVSLEMRSLSKSFEQVFEAFLVLLIIFSTPGIIKCFNQSTDSKDPDSLQLEVPQKVKIGSLSRILTYLFK